MRKFEETSFNGRCDVCAKETKVAVCASAMGATSYKYCEDCLNKGLEPYSGMVAYISIAGKYPDKVNVKYVEYIREVLKELGKTEEEFAADCNRSNE